MTELQPPRYADAVADLLHLAVRQVEAAIKLLDDGNTIPFIARYRKEATDELDEKQLRDIAEHYESLQNLHQRKADVLRMLEEQGVFVDEALAQKLTLAITAAKTITEIDDLYRPYRPKRKTRASVARERGLQPLCDFMMDNVSATEAETTSFASNFIAQEAGIHTTDEALQGACDIFAEVVADDAQSRGWIRSFTMSRGILRVAAVDEKVESVYEVYYRFEEPLTKLPNYRVLAVNRGEREGFLKVGIAAPEDEILRYLVRRHLPSAIAAASGAPYVRTLLERAVFDAYKRLIEPSIEREIRSQLTERAQEHAIQIFGENLRNLLMQPPVRQQVVLGVDPAYRTGCKLAVIDDTGKLQTVSVIYPTPPQNRVADAKTEVRRLLDEFTVTLIAIGNGTASRETEAFIAECVKEYREQVGRSVPYAMVSEAGASVYSASPLAAQEFPALDLSLRSAISIARRIQDPLAELVKIDPKSVGVGQYQHDVAQKKLGEKLDAVVESAVNQVGVDLNTASHSLLSYVAGLSKTVAKNIVDYRDQNGRFKNRKQLAKVPRLGPKSLEQCVGFLRITDGDEVLDATPIHPESYPAVTKMLGRTGYTRSVLQDTLMRKEWIRALREVPLEELSAETAVGAPTLRDILDALERPERDPRDDVPPPVLRTDVLKIEDLQPDMVLTGTVRNVVDFGAFVDIGIKNDGLVHISQLADRFVKHPMQVVSVGDVVKVRVLDVDLQKQRVALSMKNVDHPEVF